MGEVPCCPQGDSPCPAVVTCLLSSAQNEVPSPALMKTTSNMGLMWGFLTGGEAQLSRTGDTPWALEDKGSKAGRSTQTPPHLHLCTSGFEYQGSGATTGLGLLWDPRALWGARTLEV